MRIDREAPVESGQAFEIDRFRPEDAAGIANLYYSVYGPGYPLDLYYIPERIIEENSKGNLHTVVARTAKGDIVAQGALYLGSSPFGNLYELGQYLVLRNYRETFAAFRITRYIADTHLDHVRPDGVFGESVCNHVTSQKVAAMVGLKDVALELALMPSLAYEKEQSAAGRVSCVIGFRSVRDRPHEVFVPTAYREPIEYMVSDCGLSRTFTPAGGTAPPEVKSEVTAAHFDYAAVARLSVVRVGADFEPVLAGFEKEAEKSPAVVLQCFINLDAPWVGSAVDLLVRKGYFLGGYVPRWFDSDGLLMQKLLAEPDFEGIALLSDKANRIRDYVREDCERAMRR